MKKTKILASLLATIVLGVGMQANALSNVKTASIKYSSQYSTEVVLADGKIHSDQTASAMMPSNTKIAINGGFFNSYYNASSSMSYPSNVPVTYGAVVKDGYVVNAGGTNNSIAFTYDGKILMDRVQVSPYILLNSKTKITAWAVNTIYSDSTAISIMTDDFPYSFNVSSGAKVFTIKDGKVTAVSSQTTHTVASGTMKLVYNTGAITNAEKWGTLPAVGDKAEFSSMITSTTSNSEIDNIQTLVSGGRMLVIGGKNVSANKTYNSTYDSQDKQDNTSVLQRSYIYTTADGTVYFETATGSFAEIASTLVSKGAVNAISMDGGASSMLYDNGTYKTPAGRQLATIIAIIPNNGGVAPEKPQVESSAGSNGSSGSTGTTTPSQSANEPSSWAVKIVTEAEDLGIVPTWLRNNYTTPMTRQEFCELLTQYIKVTTGSSVDEIRTLIGANYAEFTFTDTDSYQVRSIASLGIINGKGDGRFDPDGSLTREEAATMLSRLVDLIGSVQTTKTTSFSDSAKISSWAKEAVTKITSYEIMNGNTNGTFAPSKTYTREEAYITMINAMNKITVKLPEQVTSSGMSEWAESSVEEAISLGLIPTWVQNTYRKEVTKDEMAQVLVEYIKVTTGKTVDEIRGLIGADYSQFTFTDTESYQVRSVSALGLMSGDANGAFNPTSTLTREEVAVIMSDLVALIGSVSSKTSVTFTDESSMSASAKEAVLEVCGYQIMSGTTSAIATSGVFEPKTAITREQLFVTMYNANKAITVKLPEQVSSSGISSWAEELVLKGQDLAIIPEWMQYGYQSDLTRNDMATLLSVYINATSGTTIDGLRGQIGADYSKFTFTDTDSYYVRSVAALGLMSGDSSGAFNPNATLTQTECETIMKTLLSLLGGKNVDVSTVITPTSGVNVTKEYAVYTLVKAYEALR